MKPREDGSYWNLWSTDQIQPVRVARRQYIGPSYMMAFQSQEPAYRVH